MSDSTVSIVVNNAPVRLKAPLRLTELLKHMACDDQSVAVAVNLDFVPRSRWANHFLQPGDQVEIVAPMQGG
ncbi:MAG: sulfur carrier protein ThiS [Hydrogenovibrio sp.]|uniref:sulfur carrier protein ThiS n=1 Tax=Hydrogenovibrio TaxID=28884 RepID=UPI00037A44FB|nr:MULTISPECIES: sulfur carrier protein ThiS [Hydrogenovibrio]MDR9498312.1 sulfur carrier protein ThiS [Hydrogenovibrio sp.]